MQFGMYLNAAGSLAAETRLDVIANNLANVDTPGFRRGFAVFQKRLTEAHEAPRFEPSVRSVLDRVGGGLLVHEVTFDAEQGALEQTGEPLDLALFGEGWFTLSVDGDVRFTRSGNFVRGADGTLMTSDGRGRVLDTDARPIVLGEGAVNITEDGAVQVDNQRVAQLKIQGRVDHRRFVPAGDNLYRFVGSGAPETSTARVQQGFLERSRVSPVREMVTLIRTFRAYEANQNMIQHQDEALGRAVNDVGRLS